MHRCRLFVSLCLLGMLSMAPVAAHEGHDHDKPAPLALPVAPRVIAVTPELELVGVRSGKDRLTIFLHTFATNEPIKGARMTVAAGTLSAEATPQGDGVFSFTAPWLAATDALDLVFSLTLADGSQDLLVGQLQSVAPTDPKSAQSAATRWSIARLKANPEFALVVLVAAMVGALTALLFAGARRREQRSATADTAISVHTTGKEEEVQLAPAAVTPLRRGIGVFATVLLLALTLSLLDPKLVVAADPAGPVLPSVPATMATDLAQRTPDGTLFVPKATQHLLSLRTMLTESTTAAMATELTGVVIAGPENLGRVQPGRPGRIEAALGGLAYVGKRVEKGQILAYVQTYIEAADRTNIDAAIAETEARIEKNRTILSRYEARPGSVPQVKVDEVRGELNALVRKRAGLLPSNSAREPILAPISGVISVANATLGQVVEARDVLFEIIDPSQFWIEAQGHGHEAHVTQSLSAAHAMIGSRKVAVEFVGRGPALRLQASIMTFRITGEHAGLSVGMPVKVIVQSSTKIDGFVLPASAILRGQTGLPIVWIKSEPERFEPQIVKVEPLDGQFVVVTAGLKADQRIVTDGATLLNQVR